MYLARDNEGHSKVCFMLILKVNFGGQVAYVSLFEILNIGYVQIDTEKESVSRMQFNSIQKIICIALPYRISITGGPAQFSIY